MISAGRLTLRLSPKAVVESWPPYASVETWYQLAAFRYACRPSRHMSTCQPTLPIFKLQSGDSLETLSWTCRTLHTFASSRPLRALAVERLTRRLYLCMLQASRSTRSLHALLRDALEVWSAGCPAPPKLHGGTLQRRNPSHSYLCTVNHTNLTLYLRTNMLHQNASQSYMCTEHGLGSRIGSNSQLMRPVRVSCTTLATESK